VTKQAMFAIGREDGLLYLLNTDNGIFEPVPIDLSVKLISTSAMSRKQVYAVGEDGIVLYLEFKRNHPGTFERLGDIPMKKVAVGSKHIIRHNEVWAIGVNNFVYRWAGTTWMPLQYQVQDLSVGMDNSVYAVDLQGHLLQFQEGAFGLAEKCFRGDNNTPRDALLSNVTAYKKKYLYALEQGTGNILRAVL
jgi:hypothetical protein